MASPGPNVIADLEVGAPETVLILAHYDVVPVPAEQLSRWKSPPHTLTARADGRLYARGSNDDLGSGVVGSMMALARLAEGSPPPRNVRLFVCCDEETGGEGGIEAIKHHDAALPPKSPDRFLVGDVVLIPDAGPETIVGSSGVAFLEASFDRPVPLREATAYGDVLVGLHEVARTWRSALPSPDWPDRHAPEPVITGRASVTKFDRAAPAGASAGLRLVGVHAESDAANQIARAVTLLFEGPPGELAVLPSRLRPLLAPPFRLGDRRGHRTCGPAGRPRPPGGGGASSRRLPAPRPQPRAGLPRPAPRGTRPGVGRPGRRAHHLHRRPPAPPRDGARRGAARRAKLRPRRGRGPRSSRPHRGPPGPLPLGLRAPAERGRRR